MKVTSTLLMVCMLAAAGAAGQSDRLSSTSAEVVQPTESTVSSAAQSDEAIQWNQPASPYVAPKVPI